MRAVLKLLVVALACIMWVGCARTVRVHYSQAKYEMRRVPVDAGAPGGAAPRYHWVKTVTGTRTVYRKERRIDIGKTALWVLVIVGLTATLTASSR